MNNYIHKVNYYETDKMGLTHHSNYVRWMEEARIDFFEQLNWSYKKFEDEGIASPVTSIECKFKQATTFPDEVNIAVSIKELSGIRLTLGYTMKNSQDKVVCEATSEHCFLKDGRLARIDKLYPEFYSLLSSMIKK